MRHRHRRDLRHGAAATALLVVALVAGCGDNSGAEDLGVTTAATSDTGVATTTASSPPAPAAAAARSDESLIRGAITAVFASGDPAAVCEKYATPKYVATAFGDLSGCRAAQQSGAAAKGVTMTGIVVDGETAKAIAVPIGGPSADETIDLTLVKEGAVWRVDTAKSKVPVGP